MKEKRNVWIIVFILFIVIFACWLFFNHQVKTAVEQEGVEVLDDMTISE